MNSLSLEGMMPQPGLDIQDEENYHGLLAGGEEEELEVDEDRQLIDLLIAQQIERNNASLAKQQRSEEQNKLARMAHERAYFGP